MKWSFRKFRMRIVPSEGPAAQGASRTTEAAAVCAGEGVGAAPAARVPAIASLASLLTRHVLRDGELVLLILKPSRWFILINSMPTIAAALIILGALHLARAPHFHLYFEAALFVIGGCLTWYVLQWMGRLYVLTDQRVLRLAGIFSIEVFDCPLRRVSRTRIIRTPREQVLALGSIEIIPSDEDRPCALWQTVCRPREVQEQIQGAIRRSRQGGWGTAA
ncbi:MAG TPA: PH domain-containing protein [Tepidisphaeraceae bacterium]|nr:PH domain-containing protein [Tepidisphaeraceae bacterium]